MELILRVIDDFLRRPLGQCPEFHPLFRLHVNRVGVHQLQDIIDEVLLETVPCIAKTIIKRLGLALQELHRLPQHLQLLLPRYHYILLI